MAKKTRLLVIDDEESILSTLGEFFTLKNYDFVGVNDGQDAIRLLHAENGKFDLVMTDLKMKGVSGIAVTQWTKKHFPHIPVVVITAFLVQYETMAVDAKPDLMLEKPLDFSKLELVIRNLLSGGAARPRVGRAGV